MRTATPSRLLCHLVTLVVALIALLPAEGRAQVKAQVPANVTPAWSKGIQPISRESYWNAVECGKQGGAQPPCVFYDTGLCKNDDFVLAMYTPYKQVAYEVWQAVSQKKDPPTPSYQAAQRTRVVIGISPAAGTKNRITGVAVKRGGQTVAPDSKVVDGGRGTFTFDFAAFAPTATVTLEMTGQTRTVTCVFDRATLARLR